MGKQKSKQVFLLVFDTAESQSTMLFGRVKPHNKDSCAVEPPDSSSESTTASSRSRATSESATLSDSEAPPSDEDDSEEYEFVGSMRMFRKPE